MCGTLNITTGVHNDAQISEIYGHLPLSFEANGGQTDGQVDFVARSSGYTLFLASAEAVLRLGSVGAQRDGGLETSHNRRDGVLRWQLFGAGHQGRAVGLEELPGRVNYLVGADPARWCTGIPTYERVAYREILPGVDLVYYGKQGQLEYDFVVKPGANPDVIQLGFSGAQTMKQDGHGDLRLGCVPGQVRLRRPQAYQDVNGVREVVTAGYTLAKGGRVGFRLGTYDPRVPLVIDPMLVYSAYLGGAGADSGAGIAVDDEGQVYVTGSTTSSSFPTAHPLQPENAGGRDIFVVKLNPEGSSLVYATYLGGNDADEGTGIAVDRQGNAYITGSTRSADFPTVNPQSTSADLGPCRGENAFVVKLNSEGSALEYAIRGSTAMDVDRRGCGMGRPRRVQGRG
jgi:hypothetical protein